MTRALIALEGIDGSGKSAQAVRLKHAIERRGLPSLVLHLYGSTLLNAQFDRLNTEALIGAREASLMTAAELVGRMERLAAWLPASDSVIVWDKYVAGSWARDRTRGVPEAVLRAIYDVIPRPDLTIFLSLSPEEALRRKRRDGGPKLWESGLDLALGLEVREVQRRLARGELAPSLVDEQFLAFQGRVTVEYRSLLGTDTVVIDAHAPVDEVAAEILRAVASRLALPPGAGEP